MQQIWQLWKDAANDPISKTVVTIFVLVLLILIAVYVVGWFRNLAVGKEEPVNAFDDLESLRNQGKISSDEYERLKKTVSKKLAADLTGTHSKKSEIGNRASKDRSSPQEDPINLYEPPEPPDAESPDFKPWDESQEKKQD